MLTVRLRLAQTLVPAVVVDLAPVGVAQHQEGAVSAGTVQVDLEIPGGDAQDRDGVVRHLRAQRGHAGLVVGEDRLAVFRCIFEIGGLCAGLCAGCERFG